MKIFIFLFFYFFYLYPAYSNNADLVSYPFTAKELFIECESWIPGQTAVQQADKKEVPCIRFIQSTINTYQLIKSENNSKLPDLCISDVLNLHRHKDVFIKYVKNNVSSENLDASKIIIESLIKAYCK